MFVQPQEIYPCPCTDMVSHMALPMYPYTRRTPHALVDVPYHAGKLEGRTSPMEVGSRSSHASSIRLSCGILEKVFANSSMWCACAYASAYVCRPSVSSWTKAPPRLFNCSTV